MTINEIIMALAVHCKKGCSTKCMYFDDPTGDCMIINHIVDNLSLDSLSEVQAGRYEDYDEK